jgi:serralysin
MSLVSLTDSQIQTGLQSGNILGPAQFTYSIPGVGSTWETSAGNYTTNTSSPSNDYQPFDSQYSTLNASQIANFILAITAWDSLIAPNFTQVADNASGHGEVRVAFTSNQMGGSTAGYAFQGSNQTPTSIVGDVWLNSTDAGKTYDVGTSQYFTFLHELGHVLGLKHPFESPTLPSYDDTRYTVMSYTVPYAVVITGAGGGYNVNWTPVNAITPQVLDIAAVQHTYGANPSYNNGDNTYTFTQDALTTQSIYDTGGTDTLDLGNFTRENIVDLRPGSYSSIGHWTQAQQQAYYAALTGASVSTIADYYNNPAYEPASGMAGHYYEWTDNLGIAFGTTIENVIGGSGNDTITGNDAANILYLQKGGNDTVSGGAADDGFYFGAAMTALDSTDGGTGTHDQVGLQGNYSSGLTFGANALVNDEQLVLISGNDARFGDTAGNYYSYNLTPVDANVAAGQQLAVTWNTLRAGENATFNGAAERDGSFITFAGAGNDTITGGQQNDSFYFGYSRWSVSDSVDGQGGTLDEMGLQGNYSATGSGAIVFGATQLTGIELLVCMSGGDSRYGAPAGVGYSYNLTMNDGNVAAGQTLYISANMLRAAGGALASDETLTFNGAAETNGNFVLYCGAGADTIVGGAGGDTIYGGNGADTLTGGVGLDVFALSATSNSVVGAADHILDFANGDKIGLSAIDAVAGGSDDPFHFIGSAPFTGAAGELRAYQSGDWYVEGDVNGDGAADFQIHVTSDHALTSADFIL